MRGKTRLNQRHVMSAFFLYPVFRIEEVSMEPITYVAKDEHDEVDRILVDRMVETVKKVYERFKIPVKMIFDEDARKLHESATVCFACNKKFNGDKVRDHCHFTDKYRGALYSKCNLKLGRKSLIIPVFAHNNSGYDSHMFVKRLADTEGGVSCIADNEKKYITFSKDILVDVVEDEKVYVKLKFLDTFRFMNKSLAGLVETTTKFEHTDRYFTSEQQELMRRKEVYLYDYMSDFTKLTETEPPPREAFNSWLNSTEVVSCTNEFHEMRPVKITDEDYDHFMEMWKRSGSKTLGDLTEFYVKGDTLQLADVFENFIDVCMKKYGLDPSYYVTAAHLANDAMLKVTGVNIELLIDPDMYLFFEESKRGGVPLAMKRYMKANNKFMKDYDPEKPDVFIEYLDKNGLYTSILAGPLPFSKFRWLTEEEIGEMMEDHTKIRSCTLKVDLEYPKELHDIHNEYPLAVESVVVDGVKKLIPNLYNKEKYVVHHEASRCYLRNGMVLKKIHGGISYEEQDFMKKFIDINAEARKVAKDDFENDFYKLMSNSVFGKTMENVRNREDIEIFNNNEESDWKKLLRCISKPNYGNSIIFENSQLVSVRMRPSSVCLNKSIQHGVSVLDRAKVPMYSWHYEYMKPKYGDKAKAGYTDTDSFLYEIHTENFFEDIREDVPTMFDTSAYPENHPAGLPRMNKKVPGLMKDEACGRIITKVVCLGPKQYAYEIDEYDDMCEKEFCDGLCGKIGCVGNGGKKCKGVKKGVVKNTLTVEHHKNCLRNDTTYCAKFNTLRSRRHDITTECVTKIALTAADNKRIIIPIDPEHRTLALGHWRTKHPCLYNVDIDTKKLFSEGTLMNLAYNAI